MTINIRNALAGCALAGAALISQGVSAGQKINIIFASDYPGAFAVLAPGPAGPLAGSGAALPPGIVVTPQTDPRFVRQYGPYPVMIDKPEDFLMIIRYAVDVASMFENRNPGSGFLPKSGSMGVALTTEGGKVTGCNNTNNFPSQDTPPITALLESVGGAEPTCIITFVQQP